MKYEILDAKRIGDTIKDLRDQAGKNQQEVAIALGITQSAMAMYESGERIPRDEIKIRIAEFFGAPVEDIFFPQKQHVSCDMSGIDFLIGGKAHQ